MRSKAIFALAAIGVLAAAVHVVGLEAGTREGAERPLPSKSMTVSCRPGTSKDYDLSYRAVGRFEPQAAFPTGLGPSSIPTDNAIDLEAGLRLTCLDSTRSGGDLLQVELFGVVGRASGFGMETADPEALSGDAVYVRRHPSGLVGDIVFPVAWSDTQRNVVRDVLTHVSFSLGDGSRWRSREGDLNGVYSAGYDARVTDAGSLTLRKVRDSYEGSDESSAEVQVHQDSETELQLVRDGDVILAIESVRSRVKLAFLRGDVSFGESDSSVSLTATGEEVSARGRQATEVNVAELVAREPSRLGDLTGRDARRRIEAAMNREKLGKDDAASLEATLLDRSPAENFQKLRALFVLRPEDCGRFAALLAELDRKDPRFAAILAALAAAGNAEAQAALVDALAGLDRSLDKQLLILGQLGLLDRATSETEAAVREWTADGRHPDLQQTARLALGNIARRLAPVEADRARRIEDDAMEEYRRADGTEAKFHAILALGNIGSAQLLAEVREDLQASDPMLRAAVVTALRFVDAPEAEATIAQATIDSSDRVREAAVDALGYRKLSPAAIEGLKSRLTNEPDARTRIMILRTLARYVGSDAILVAAIEDRRRNDPAEDVRDFADSILLR